MRESSISTLPNYLSHAEVLSHLISVSSGDQLSCQLSHSPCGLCTPYVSGPFSHMPWSPCIYQIPRFQLPYLPYTLSGHGTNGGFHLHFTLSMYLAKLRASLPWCYNRSSISGKFLCCSVKYIKRKSAKDEKKLEDIGFLVILIMYLLPGKKIGEDMVSQGQWLSFHKSKLRQEQKVGHQTGHLFPSASSSVMRFL